MPTTRPDPLKVRAQIAAYVAKLPPDSRRAVKTIRTAIRTANPRAVEHFSYGIPGFKLDGKPLLWYAGWKTHVSLYPITAGMVRAHAKQIAHYRAGKGTLKFSLADDLPVSLIGRLAKTRAKEIRSGAR